VNNLALKVDEVDLAAATLRREQSETWKCSVRITSTQTGPETFGFDLFNRRHNFPPFRRLEATNLFASTGKKRT
jgi:hypothetical protein